MLVLARENIAAAVEVLALLASIILTICQTRTLAKI